MDFTQIATNFGVAVAALVALGVAVWRAGVWIGRNIAQPVANRHIKFLDELSSAMANQSQAMQTMAIQQGRNLTGIEKIMERMEVVVEKQDQMLRTISEVQQRVTSMTVKTDSVIVHQSTTHPPTNHPPPQPPSHPPTSTPHIPAS